MGSLAMELGPADVLPCLTSHSKVTSEDDLRAVSVMVCSDAYLAVLGWSTTRPRQKALARLSRDINRAEINILRA